MARKPVFDDCMLCGECPCTCKKIVKKAPAKRAKAAPKVVEAVPACGWCTAEDRANGLPCACTPPPVTPDPVDTPASVKADPRAAMRAAAGRARGPRPLPVAPASPVRYVPQTTGDTVIDDAIRRVASLLHPDEKAKYQDLMWSNPTVTQRAAIWQNRRRELLDGQQAG